MVSNKSLDDRFMFSPDVNTTLINTDSELEKILSNLRHTKGCQAVRIGTARETILDPNTDPVCRLVTRILENSQVEPQTLCCLPGRHSSQKILREILCISKPYFMKESSGHYGMFPAWDVTET